MSERSERSKEEKVSGIDKLLLTETLLGLKPLWAQSEKVSH